MMIDKRRVVVRLKRWLTILPATPAAGARRPGHGPSAHAHRRGRRRRPAGPQGTGRHRCTGRQALLPRSPRHNRGRRAGRPADLPDDPQDAPELPAQPRALLGLRLRRDRPCRGRRPAIHRARALLPRLRPIAGPATRGPPSRAAGSPHPASTAPTQRRRHRRDHRNVARHRTAHPTPRTQPATPRTTNRISRPVLPDMIGDRRPRQHLVSAPTPPGGRARSANASTRAEVLQPDGSCALASASSTRCQRRPRGWPAHRRTGCSADGRQHVAVRRPESGCRSGRTMPRGQTAGHEQLQTEDRDPHRPGRDGPNKYRGRAQGANEKDCGGSAGSCARQGDAPHRALHRYPLDRCPLGIRPGLGQTGGALRCPGLYQALRGAAGIRCANCRVSGPWMAGRRQARVGRQREQGCEGRMPCAVSDLIGVGTADDSAAGSADGDAIAQHPDGRRPGGRRGRVRGDAPTSSAPPAAVGRAGRRRAERRYRSRSVRL